MDLNDTEVEKLLFDGNLSDFEDLLDENDQGHVDEGKQTNIHFPFMFYC